MSIRSKPTQGEMALYEVLRHPVFCGEFVRELGMTEDWEYELYQKEMLCDHAAYVGICTARSVGKTTSLEDIVMRHSLNKFFSGMMFTVPNQVHIDPPFLRLVALYQTNPLLKHFVNPRKSFNSQKYNILFKNGFIFDGRVAGTGGTGQNVVGAHYPLIIVDEGGLYPWGTWVELQPCLNSFEPGAQMIVAGVPTGLRDRNVLYLVDMLLRQYTKHNCSAHRNPRYTKADEERNVKQYGGKDSEDYKHLVLGQHGSPVYALFDRALMLFERYRYPVISLTREDHKDNINVVYLDISTLPRFPAYAEGTIIGMDCGYTEPTVIIPMYFSSGRWRILYRLILYQCKYPVQREILSILRSNLNPDFIGIDEGHGGRAFFQELTEHNPKVAELVVPINFSSNVPVGYTDEGKEINVRAKQFGMQKLQQMVNAHDIVFSEFDEPLVSELESMTYTKSALGAISYKPMSAKGGSKGGDHNVSALLSALVALHLRTDLIGPPGQVPLRQLLKPGWLT